MVVRTMGFVLSILYFVTSYLTPVTLFGQLAAYHIELILAALIFLVSLPKLSKSFIFRTPQSLALIGLAGAVVASVLIAVRWPGGAVHAFLEFIPFAFAYFLVCLHCNSKRKLKILILMLMFVCLFVIAHGYIDLRHGAAASGPPDTESTETAAMNPWNMAHPYLIAMRNGKGDWIYRLRGLGDINDPNDFAQLVVCLIPLVFIFWHRRRMPRNIVLVLLPVCVLLYGTFLTHSRGALLALLAMVLVASRRRIGALPALLIAGGLFVAATTMNFTGGRDISISAGVDRTTLWGEGLQLLKSHPLFGVGLGNFGEYSDAHLTAHNSVLVCATELGMFGLFFWSLFLFSTIRDALVIASPAKVSEGEPLKPEESPFPETARKTEALDKNEINRLGRLLVLSLVGFLVTGWFLSRAYIMMFFMLGGMVEVVFEVARRRGMIASRMRMTRLIPYAGGLAVSLVLLVYVMLRVTNQMR